MSLFTSWLPVLLILLLSPFILAAPEDDEAICHRPQILSPTGVVPCGRSFILDGYVDTTPCRANGNPPPPTLILKTQERGQIYRLDVTNTSGYFSIELRNQPLGLQHYYLVHARDEAAEAIISNVAELSVNCGRPTIIKPTGQDWLPTYNPNDYLSLDTSTPEVTGTSDCPMVTVEFSGEPPIAVAVDERGYWTAKSNYLANGNYDLTARASDLQGDYSICPEGRRLIIESRDPRPTGTIQNGRRSFIPACKETEELCRFGADVRGKMRLQYKCFPDLSTNLERCGSCHGPDCSSLPDVDEVSCESGQCKIRSCLPGFDLRSNACVRS